MKKYEKILEAVEGRAKLPFLDPSLVKSFFKDMIKIFKKEKQLIKLPKKKLIFVGDTHSDFESSKKVIKRYLKKDNILIFLGDYVDRQENRFDGVKNILYLMYMKYKNGNLILLRGNHEDHSVNSHYGFKEDISECWNEDMWEVINEVFTYMPLAVETDKIIALHGGLPDVKTLKKIENVPKGLNHGIHPVLDQVLWNDSIDVNHGIVERMNRGVDASFVYGVKFFNDKMKLFKKELLIRGHDYNVKGLIFGGRCITVFTSKQYADYPSDEKYCEKGIKGCFVVIIPKNFKTYKDAKIEQIWKQ